MYKGDYKRYKKQWQLILILLLLILSAISFRQKHIADKSSHSYNNPEIIDTQDDSNELTAQQASDFSTDSSTAAFSAGSSFPANFTLLSRSPGKWRFRFQLNDIDIEEIERADGKFSLVKSAGAWQLQNAGKPELPVFRSDFALPQNAQLKLEIISSEQELIACLPPLPSTGMLTRSAAPDPIIATDPTIYNSTEPYPEQLTEITEFYKLRNVHGAGIKVTPVQYLPNEKKLLLTRSFEAELSLADGQDFNIELDENASFAALQQELFINQTDLTRSANNLTVGSLLILLPDNWQEAAEDFVLWKRRTGFTVQVAEYPNDCGEGSNNIASYIAQKYQQNSITHLLICGDWDSIPPWKLSNEYKQDAPGPLNYNNWAGTTDSPYALLSNVDPSSPDYAADIFLSRICADSALELEGILGKLIAFERGNEESSWRSRGLFLASKDGGGLDFTWNNAFIEGDGGRVKKDYVYMERFRQMFVATEKYSETVALYAGTGFSPEASAVISALNEGTSLFYYLGHGQYNHFVTSEFSVSDTYSLHNSSALPFVVSPVCNSGNFASLRGDCLSEALIKNPSAGATAVIASTGETFWRAPIVLLWKFADLLDSYTLPDTGSFSVASILEGIRYCQATTDYSESGAQKYFYELLHLFGDSSQTVRLGQEKQLSAEYYWQPNGLQVNVFAFEDNQEIPISNAKVCLTSYNQLEEQYISACTDENGEVFLEIEEQFQRFTLRILSSVAPLLEIEIEKNLYIDKDNDGFISNNEMLSWLQDWDAEENKDPQDLVQALRMWEADGWVDNNETATRSTVDKLENLIPVFSAPERQLLIDVSNEIDLQRLLDRRANIISIYENIAVIDCSTAEATQLQEENFIILGNKSSEETATRSASSYPSYEQVIAELIDTAAQNQIFCQPYFIGKSVEGREIIALRLSLADSQQEALPELLIAAAIHGDEKPSTVMSLKLLQYICENIDEDDTDGIRNILQSSVLWLLPIMNPDGYVSNSRYNSNGADLNREFPDGVLLGEEAFGTFAAGSSFRFAGLQPEQVHIMRWLAGRNITAALHLHTGALKVCYPYGNNEEFIRKVSEAPDNDIFQDLASLYAVKNTRMSPSVVINAAAWYPVVGELADWQYRFLGTLPLTIELTGPTKQPNYNKMENLWQENLPAFLAWMNRVIDLYPEGLEAEQNSAATETWGAEFAQRESYYTPGFEEYISVEIKDFSQERPTAMILQTVIPEGWEISYSADNALQPAASRKEDAKTTSWLFYPVDSQNEKEELLFSFISSEGIDDDAILATQLLYNEGESKVLAKHLLPYPERNFNITLRYGWNSFSAPIKLKASDEILTNAFWQWNDEKFVLSNEQIPGNAYFIYFTGSSTADLQGWMQEENNWQLKTGWNLTGTAWKRKLENNNLKIFKQKKTHNEILQNKELDAGKAYWILQQ